MAWTEDLRVRRRALFQVQFYLTRAAHLGLEGVLERFPSVPKSALIRAVTSVYLWTQVRSDLAMAFERLPDGREYRALASGPRRKTTLQFSPMALLELQSSTKRLERPVHKIVEDAVVKLLCASQTPDPPFRAIWENEIKARLEMILRSA